MGRWYYNKKATVEEVIDLTVFQLKKYGMLKAGSRTSTVITWVSSCSGNKSSVNVEVNIIDDPYVKLSYSISDSGENSQSYDCEISLITSPCNLGGVRYWFACPVCWRRSGVLYLVPGERYFMCRCCNNLTYRSRNRCVMEAFGHTSRQIDKLRSQIKRWTWRGKPTRKVLRMKKLERKIGFLSPRIISTINKLQSRIG